ncbi:semaphorin-7A-like [Pungitius pungitius]|uniref:semaphorin-7A-like n=1 Tax=Pungitius pungitius TaxID=134920 RepID=UPI002E15D0F7
MGHRFRRNNSIEMVCHLSPGMLPVRLTLYVLFSCLRSLTATSTLHARMTFTEKETEMRRFPLPGHHVPVEIVLEGERETIVAAGHKHLTSFNFLNHPQTPVKTGVQCPPSPTEGCDFNITVVHKGEAAGQFVLCGINAKETLCCEMNLSQQTWCLPSENTKSITKSLQDFVIKEGEPFAFVDSDLYITYSGAQENVGIHKFGNDRIAPGRHSKEQHYVGLVLSRHEDPKESKVYAFYREKNKEEDMNSDMWLPFVTRVCTVDSGGSKNILQSSWTSQLNARLSCGHAHSRQRFSELVDVTPVHADRWEQTTIYALFRNEWGMSAVCVYTLKDIEQIFKTSSFKDSDMHTDRKRECVADSKAIARNVLRMIESNSEMKERVQPVNSGPLLFNHHAYTHIHVHGLQNSNLPVLFLSLKNGAIHKVMQYKSQAFVIAEYQPFDHKAHIVSFRLDPPSRKLYVSSRTELVQVNVANCAQYGDSCELCVLARDPYCGWNGTHCTHKTEGTLQDLAEGNYGICGSDVQRPAEVSRHFTPQETKSSVALPPESKYFLQCPMASHHAQYTWHHLESTTSCGWGEQRCLLLVDSMGPEQQGEYRCVSEERGYSRVLARYELQLRGAAGGRSWSPLLCLGLTAALIRSWS